MSIPASRNSNPMRPSTTGSLRQPGDSAPSRIRPVCSATRPTPGTPTACPHAQSASDQSVVLAAARASTESSALLRRPLTAVLGGRDLCDAWPAHLFRSEGQAVQAVRSQRLVGRSAWFDPPGLSQLSAGQLWKPVTTRRAQGGTNLSEYKPCRARRVPPSLAPPRHRSQKPG